MNKLKKLWRGLTRNVFSKLKIYSLKRKRRLIIFGSIFLGVFGFCLYYGIALARVSKAEVNLAALREEINKEKICHEDCLLTRKKQEAVIIAAIKKSEKNLLNRLETYFIDSNESFEFKKEIMNLWRLNNDLDNLPPYIYDYLDNEEGDVKLQALIISSFLSASEDRKWLDYYFSFLASERDVSLKKEVLIALSNRKNKSAEFNLKQLVFLKDLLFSLETPSEIRADLVLLIGEYYPLFPDDTGLILRTVLKNKDLDNITRAFAVDILNKYIEGEKLTEPLISETEWENYYSY